MKSDVRELPRQCLTAAILTPLLFATALPAFAAASTGRDMAVSCASPDMWTGEARTATVLATGRADDGSFTPPPVQISYSGSSEVASWNPVFKGDGASRLRGAARARVLSYGVLWIVDPAEVGATEAQAISALLRSGAVIARKQGDGRVYFRAKESDYQRIASRAVAYLGGRSSPQLSQLSAPRRGKAIPAGIPASVAAKGLGIDVAMMRLEGRYSGNPIEFIENLPGGMSVMPFGTSYAVHVPAAMVEGMWDALDGEGRRVLLVGASSPVTAGLQASQAIQYCGGSALMRRFPTPAVARKDTNSALLEVESQRLIASAGDIVLVVQTPPYGRGIEVALMRFVRR